MRRTKNRLGRLRAGFTFIELVAVMAVVVILFAIALPSYGYVVRKARRTEGRAALLALMQQQERYYTQRTRYVAFSFESTDVEARKFKWYSGDSPEQSAYEISAAACESSGLQDCILLVARPGTERVNRAFKDPACGALTLSSDGSKTADGGAADCW